MPSPDEFLKEHLEHDDGKQQYNIRINSRQLVVIRAALEIMVAMVKSKLKEELEQRVAVGDTDPTPDDDDETAMVTLMIASLTSALLSPADLTTNETQYTDLHEALKDKLREQGFNQIAYEL